MKKWFIVFTSSMLLILMMAPPLLAAPDAQRSSGETHEVAFGETLSEIAAEYGVSMADLMRLNGIANPNAIYLGQLLLIPGNTPTNPQPPPATRCAQYHTVTAGETLSDIAQEYNTTIPTLVRLNNLIDSDLVQVGQPICVPSGSGTYTPAPTPSNSPYHIVKKGETLFAISQRYGVTVREMLRYNRLANPELIRPGQRLLIPGYAEDDGGGAAEFIPQPPAPVPPGISIPPPAPPKPVAREKPPVYDVPPPPAYQSQPPVAPLPVSDVPVMVEVMGRPAWGAQVSTVNLESGITTLVVRTSDEAGKTVFIRSGDYQLMGTSGLDSEYGTAAFVVRNIQPGDYDVWIDDPELVSEKAQVRVEGGELASVAFERRVLFEQQNFAGPDGWYLANADNPSEPGKNIGAWSNILVRTPASGLKVFIRSEGGYEATCITGSKGEGACDFAGLSAAVYFINIDGTALTVKTYVDGAAYVVLDLAHQAGAATKAERNQIGPYFIDRP